MDEYAIAIALWDGVEELDFAGPYEVLTAWARFSERDDQRAARSRSRPSRSRARTACACSPTRRWADVGARRPARPPRRRDAAAARRTTLPAADARPRGARHADDERLHRRADLRPRGPARRPSGDDALGLARRAAEFDVRRRPRTRGSSTTATSSPPPASRRGSTWRCTSSRASSRSSRRRRCAATSSTTRSRRSKCWVDEVLSAAGRSARRYVTV